MDEKYTFVFAVIESSGWLAPVAFILFHILRQFIFIPVVLVCIVGGILFGSVFGTIYSLVGLTLLSAGSYFILKMFPALNQKLLNLKQKWFGYGAKLTVGQIAVLRLVPFVHYQLLNVCLMERKPALGEYVKSSFLANLPLAFFYTVFGEFISEFTPGIIILIMMGLFILFYTLREKVRVIKWQEFFHQPS
ncbi:TVP38/TMEM64 family protein [Bacillus salacetis]|uniref:TVP38/TMEM64 family protein n=1 Tax=Bacillus salacetis TaxID=2315464 RepID=A0A3A1QSY7_9BACI|nr:VTT domain-containing protein [Bacillus salacetis]RIW29736.1 TVP38/TMEM64 family protein [Bacillus salacetis]